MILSLSGLAFAQTFVARPELAILDNQVVTSTVDVPDEGPTIVDVDVIVNISHTFVGDLSLSLRSPEGIPVTLIDRQGGGGDDFIDTEFDASAPAHISTGSAPFTGVFRPALPMDVLRGWQAGGTWTLRIEDHFNGDEGVLHDWTLQLVAEGSSSLPQVDFVESTVEDVFGDVIDEGAGYNARPSTIGSRVNALVAAFEDEGCVVTDGVAGTYLRGRTPRQLGASEVAGDAIAGPNIGNLTIGGETASVGLASGGRLEGQVSDGSIVRGYFVRLNTSRSFWYGTRATCE